ncbi:MAG: hypothetical protein ACI8VJ_000453 [Polaribacter sp.]|jgi:hypothetical protein
MKTTLKKYLIVALMFGTLINYATEKNNAINVIDGKKVKVEFTAVKKGQVLSIKDANGSIIYNYIIETPGNYSKTFDLTALKNGRYTTELEKNFEIIIKPFFVENGLVTFLTQNTKTIFKPIIRTAENLVFISKMSFDNEAIKITLYYEGAVIYSETIKEGKELERIFRLLKTKKGDYRVAINSKKRGYSKSFKI